VVLPSSAFEIGRHLQHWHGGDDWVEMEEIVEPRDPAEADPERSWKGGRIYKCTTCEEQFRVMDPVELTPGP
jgi:hypothetical protein